MSHRRRFFISCNHQPCRAKLNISQQVNPNHFVAEILGCLRKYKIAQSSRDAVCTPKYDPQNVTLVTFRPLHRACKVT